MSKNNISHHYAQLAQKAKKGQDKLKTNNKQKQKKVDSKVKINGQQSVKEDKTKKKSENRNEVKLDTKDIKEKKHKKAISEERSFESAEKRKDRVSKQDKHGSKVDNTTNSNSKEKKNQNNSNKLQTKPAKIKQNSTVQRSVTQQSMKNKKQQSPQHKIIVAKQKSQESQKEDNLIKNVEQIEKQKGSDRDFEEIKKSQRKLLLLEQQLQAIEKKQRQIENSKVLKQQKYEDVILKYKQLAGKQKRPALESGYNIASIQGKQSAIHASSLTGKLTYTNNKLEEAQDVEVKSTIYHKKEQKQFSQIQNTQKSAREETKIKSASPSPPSHNKTKIRFLTQKQHDLALVLNGIENTPADGKEIKFKMDALNSTRRSLSLPTIQKNTQIDNNATGRKLKNNILSQSHVTARQTLQKRGLSSDQRLEKQKNLNAIAFMLTSLKQRAGFEAHEKNAVTQFKSRGKISGKVNEQMSQMPINESFFIQSPKKQNKSKLSIMELSNSPSKTLGGTVEMKDQNFEEGNNKSNQLKLQESIRLQKPVSQQKKQEIQKAKSPHESPQKHQAQQNQQSQSQSQSQLQKTKRVQAATVGNKKLLQKQAELNNELQEIKEDIENENNEKEQLLKQHRALNKNLQINVLEKRERINKLQAEINKYKVEEEFVGDANGLVKGQTDSLFLTQLQLEKAAKEKKFKEEQDKLKDQIKKTEKRIAQQEDKYKNLRQSQIQIKDEQLKQRQTELQIKNKQMNIELQTRNKELEQIINREQQKSKMYKQELLEQAKKNQQISNQLTKQEQLEQLLLEQIQKIAKERKNKQDRKQEQKNKEKMRLIEEIKRLEEAQSRILMEYQRDSQAANSLFEAMRLKNLQLEDQINKKKKQKQKKIMEQSNIKIETEKREQLNTVNL